MDIRAFWSAVLSQDRKALPEYFCRGAVIRWHCSNERFTVEEYVRANCDYPGQWAGEIERIERTDGTVITAVRVFPKDGSASFHVTSFLRLRDDRIQELDEYWADDGEAPEWRRQMNIGAPVRGAALEN